MVSRRLLFAVMIFIALLPMRTFAQGKTARPDVLILIYALSSGQGQVGVTYPGLVPHAQAQRDLKALQTETGWRLSGVKITDERPPIQLKKGKMTGIEFTAEGALIQGSNTLPVEPIINAFRGYRQIGLTYFTEPSFGFQGLRQYQDDHVQIAMIQHGSTYSYQIRIRDQHYGKLNLPRYQPVPGDSRYVNMPVPVRASRSWLIALVVLAAMGAGGIVYVVLAKQG